MNPVTGWERAATTRAGELNVCLLVFVGISERYEKVRHRMMLDDHITPAVKRPA